MYTTCLFCAAHFGRNESIEEFPIGRRLAFDAAKGRLWVVCGKCTRWCLVPIEERWEAVESCERAFRDSRTRVSTDQIGMAKLPGGLELVRLGSPLRPELAAWRYGREFTSRRRRTIAISAAAAAVGVTGLAAAATAGLSGIALTVISSGAPVLSLVGVLGWGLSRAVDNARAVRVPHGGTWLEVNREELKQTVLFPTNDAQAWGLELKHSWGRLLLTGEDAVRATTRLLARANGAGGAANVVQAAAAALGDGDTVTDVLRTIAERASARSQAHRSSVTNQHAAVEAVTQSPASNDAQLIMLSSAMRNAHLNPASLAMMPAVDRLAFEMALHEERERRAMHGELAPLLEAWREAERVAEIGDALLVPGAVDAKLGDMRADRDRGHSDPRS
jgi:hypothetical protein